MEIDLGGDVKECAADEAAALCREMGGSRGIVDLGCDLALFGANPDGSPWRIGAADPDEPAHAALTLLIHGRAGVATSGVRQRFLELEGRRFSPIFDLRNSWPIEGPLSVAVFAENCAEAGALASIAMLNGEEGPDWLAPRAGALPRDIHSRSHVMIIDIPHLQPIVAIIAGVLILIQPKIMNAVVAIYLILTGILGLGFLR